MGDQPYTEEDVQRAAGAVHRAESGCEIEHKARHSDGDEEIARAVLGVLAEAGRLLPPDLEDQIGVRVDVAVRGRHERVGDIITHFGRSQSLRAREAWHGWTPVRRAVGPWVEVPQQDEETPE
jgi:hypothetical protein